MASTYSTNLKLELQGTGENPGTWGTITNTNLGTALEQAIVGYGNPSYASDANLTLTYTDTNAAQTARSLVLNVTSAVSLTATRELVVPTIQKQYIVQNNTTGAQSITVKTSAGTGITVPNGRKAHLYVDGTNVIQMSDFVDINGGTIDGTPIGASSASTGAFTTLTASSTATLSGLTASTALALDASKNIASVTNTGTGNNVLATSPTLTTPNLGTPSALTLTNATGLPIDGGTINTLPVNRGGSGATTLTGVLKGNGTSAFTASNVSLSSEVTGTLPVANGGTGLTGGTSGGLPYFSAASTLASSGVLAANALVIGGGAGAAPSTTTTGTGILTFLGTPSSSNLAAAVTDETGSGALVFGTSPSLTTPALSGETFSTNAAVTAGTNAQGQGALTSDYNIVTTASNNPSGVTLPTATTGRRIIIVNKGANPINVFPASGGAIDALGASTPISIVVGGYMEFNASSTTQWYSTANIIVSSTGAVTSFSAGATGLTPSSATTGAITLGGTLAVANGGTGITSFGTGVATALGVNTGSSGAFVVNGGALGTPSSGTVTNLTGTASININGTVGATTPATGAFTTLSATTLGAALNANSQAITNANIDSGTIDGVTIGGASAGAGTFTTLTTSSTVTLNGGTANGLLYLNGSKVATSGSAVTFDGTNLATTGTASATKLIPTGGTATGNGMYLPAANTLALSTNGTERVRVDSSGNLGIGVTPSAWNSATKNIQNPAGSLFSINTTDSGVSQNLFLDSTGTWKYVNTAAASYFAQSSGAFIWSSVGSGTAGATAALTTKMTLDAAGNLTVGQSTSNATLADAGYVSIKNTANTSGFDIGLLGGSSDINAFIYQRANGYLAFGTNNTERARITSSGNLLVGTTTDFTTTSAAGGVAVTGYGIYPYTSYSSSSPSGATNTTGRTSFTVQNQNLAIDGSASTTLAGFFASPLGSNSGASGASALFLYGGYFTPYITSSGASGRVGLVGTWNLAVRASSSDLSSHASNLILGTQSIAGIEGTVGTSASAASVTGGIFLPYVGNGTTTTLAGVQSAPAVADAASDKSSTVTNASAYYARFSFGASSGAVTATVTNAYGVNLTSIVFRATATVTNYYALYAAAPTVTGTLTNRWGIYIDDASSPNYFAGSVRVGAGTAAAPTLTTIADTDTGVFFPAADVVGVSTNGTERARVKSTGQVRFVPLSADPAGAEAGDVYYNSTGNKLKVYNGTSWVDLH